MKKEEQVRTKASERGVNTQSKTSVHAADQSAWGKTLRDDLEASNEAMRAAILGKYHPKKEDSWRRVGEIAGRLNLGFLMVGSRAAVPRIVLEGRWLEEAGFKAGQFVSIKVDHLGSIELKNVGDRR